MFQLGNFSSAAISLWWLQCLPSKYAREINFILTGQDSRLIKYNECKKNANPASKKMNDRNIRQTFFLFITKNGRLHEDERKHDTNENRARRKMKTKIIR